MTRVTRFLRRLDVRLLAVLAVGALLAPWPFGPEPHVLEKGRWLLQGALRKPLDIFDLFFHSAPALLLLARMTVARRIRDDEESGTPPHSGG